MKNMKKIFAFCLLVCVTLSLCSCGSSSNKMAMVETAYDSVGYAPMMTQSVSNSLSNNSDYALNDIKVESYSAEAGSGSSSSGSATNTNSETPKTVSNKIIYRGSLRVHTSDIGKTEDLVVNKISEYNGYISNYEKDDSSYVRINARIPSENFDKMLNDGDIAKDNSVSKTMSAEDVTLAYSDVEAELESLKIQEERLLTYLQSAENVEDMMNIENSLQNVRRELGTIGSRLKYLDNYIEYSELEIYISARYIAPEEATSFGERIQIAFAESIDNLTEFFTDLVIGIILNWPWLLFCGVIIFIVVKVVRNKKKKKLKKLEEQKANDSKIELK